MTICMRGELYNFNDYPMSCTFVAIDIVYSKPLLHCYCMEIALIYPIDVIF